MVCFQCGSPVSAQAKACPNCGAALQSTRKRLNEGGSQGLRRMTMELKAIDISGQLFPPGEVIAGRFRVGEMIGEGPFGQVFKAHDTLADTDVALKVFAPDVLRNPVDQERFLNATRAARALTQRNVVRLHDSGVHKDHAWISMQHLEGLNLRKLLDLRKVKGEGFSLEEIEPVIGQITLALQHIGREYPHGNLKPENIILLPDFIKVTDSYVFAALSGDVFRSRLKDSAYLAPELHQGSDLFDARCDVYSVGKIIGEMYYGDVDAVGTAGRNSALDALYERATAVDVTARYESVEALAEDLGTLLDTGMLLQMRQHGAHVPPPAPNPGVVSGFDPHLQGPAFVAGATSVPGVELSVPEEDIATIEVRRSPVGLPHAAGSTQDGSNLGDLLDTIEADRTQMPPPLTTPERLETRQSAGRISTVVEPAASATTKKDGGVPLVLIVVGAVVALAVFALVMLKKPDNEVVTLGDGTALTAQAKADHGADEHAAKADELSQALLAANDAVMDSALKTSDAAAESEKVGVSDEAAEKAAAEKAAAEEQNAAQIAEKEAAEKAAADNAAAAQAAALKAEQDRGASSAGVSAAPATGAPAREPAIREPVVAKVEAPKAAVKEPVVAETPKMPAGQGLDCPAGMVLLKSKNGNFCVDAHEFPGKGATPKTNTTWFDARKQCVNQGKRLCALTEWKQACGSKYPYGTKFNPDSCNTADEDGFERSLARAGSFAQCRSRSGAFDMSGNVHEWVEEQRVAGGGFDSDESVASCGYSSPKAAGSSSGSIGFRCCTDAN